MRITTTDNKGTRSVSFSENTVFVVGRNNDDLAIEDTRVSREHLEVKSEHGSIYLRDTSSNGCYIRGKRLEKDKWIRVTKNDKIDLTSDGKVSIFIDKEYNDKSKPNSFLSLVNQKGKITIGRNSTSDIVLTEKAISRTHAIVEKKGNQVFVTDLSLNGIYINGKRIQRKSILLNSDELRIGLNTFSLSQEAKVLKTETAIQVNKLSFNYPNGIIGLQETSFQLKKEKMIALMGPSGCGKSTLLKLLNGYHKPSSGSISIFGLDLTQNFDILKQFIGYVPQENIVHEYLTVEEAMYFTAKLRLGNTINSTELQERIDSILSSLKISDKEIRESFIKNLSGGQKKRVSIAVELITQPEILFLDEPTSPLDPETIEEFLKSLKGLCEMGTTVVMVTHKPEDLSAMDKVLFMAKHGHLVYQGQQENLCNYFETESISKVYTQASDAQQAKLLYTKWNAKSENRPKENVKSTPIESHVSTHPFHQLKWLVLRYTRLKWNNRRNLIVAFSQPIIIALLILLVFPHLKDVNDQGVETGNLGVIFIMALSVVWFGVSNSAKEIVAERAIVQRERAFNLLFTPYLLSKSLVLLALTSLQTLVFIKVLYFGFSGLTDFFWTFIFLSIVGFSSVCFGLLLSVFSKSTEAVMTMLPVALIPQIVLAGIVHPLENGVTQFLSYFTLGRWGTEGIARIQDRLIQADPLPFLHVIENNLYTDGQTLQVASISGNAIVLLLLSALFLFVTFFKLQQQK
jgi:ABC-type multidrug transport system ATPase subunit/ABC-type multidrug transport system permease subunit